MKEAKDWKTVIVSKPAYVEFLLRFAERRLQDFDLQSWWDTNSKSLCAEFPILIYLRFIYGGEFGAQATLNSLGLNYKIHEPHTNSSSTTLAQTLQSLNRSGESAKLRDFATFCCKRQSHLLSDKWRAGLYVSESFANGHAAENEWQTTLESLAKDFWSVRESDAGEITAAKGVVLGTFDPSSLFAALISSAAVATSVLCELGEEGAFDEEEQRQLAYLVRDVERPDH